MTKLKEYWDSIETAPISDPQVDESLENALTSIRRRQNLKKAVLYAIAPCLLIAAAVIFRPKESSPIMQIYAPMGEKREVLLSEGTKVTLNSGSTIVYSEQLGKKRREVFLNGEAAFEVTKNAKAPFIVHTHSFDVQVLGTTFDVSAYTEKRKSSVVLVEGSVKIINNGHESILIPGQKAEFEMNDNLNISQVEAQDYLNWKRGGFVLRKAGISDIIDILEREYNLNVSMKNSGIYDKAIITAKSTDRMDIGAFLNMLNELIPDMQYTLDIENNTLSLY